MRKNIVDIIIDNSSILNISLIVDSILFKVYFLLNKILAFDTNALYLSDIIRGGIDSDDPRIRWLLFRYGTK